MLFLQQNQRLLKNLILLAWKVVQLSWEEYIKSSDKKWNNYVFYTESIIFVASQNVDEGQIRPVDLEFNIFSIVYFFVHGENFFYSFLNCTDDTLFWNILPHSVFNINKAINSPHSEG